MLRPQQLPSDFDGARDLVDAVRAHPSVLSAVSTGLSMRGTPKNRSVVVQDKSMASSGGGGNPTNPSVEMCGTMPEMGSSVMMANSGRAPPSHRASKTPTATSASVGSVAVGNNRPTVSLGNDGMMIDLLTPSALPGPLVWGAASAFGSALFSPTQSTQTPQPNLLAGIPSPPDPQLFDSHHLLSPSLGNLPQSHSSRSSLEGRGKSGIVTTSPRRQGGPSSVTMFPLVPMQQLMQVLESSGTVSQTEVPSTTPLPTPAAEDNMESEKEAPLRPPDAPGVPSSKKPLFRPAPTEAITTTTLSALLYKGSGGTPGRSAVSARRKDNANLKDVDPDVEGVTSPTANEPLIGENHAFHGLGGPSATGDANLDFAIAERVAKIIVQNYKQSLLRAESSSALNHLFTTSVLSVSKYFDAKSSGGGAAQSENANQRRQLLSASHHTRIPARYWVLRDPVEIAPLRLPSAATTTTTNSKRDSAPAEGVLPQRLDNADDVFLSMHLKQKALTFPSTNPTNRTEVYLLAHTLDKMIRDFCPDAESLLDPSIAFEIIPPSLADGGKDSGETVLHRYTNAARQFFHVLDVAMSEIARQMAPVVIERASLLDCIRQITNDVTETMLQVVAQCKQRAFDEAKRRQEYDDIIMSKNRQIIDARSRIVALEERILELETEVEVNELKAQRFDVIVGRMDHNEQQRERAIIRADQMELIDEVDEIVSRGAVNAAHNLDAAISGSSVFGTGGAGGASHTSAVGADGKTVVIESSVAKLERLKREAEQRANEQLYQSSIKLMRWIREAVQATDAACEPFYQRMLFGAPELNASVASGRWAAIGKAIGEHEAMWDHRQRVVRAHTLWFEVVASRLGHSDAGALADDDTSSDPGSTGRSTISTAISLSAITCTVEQLQALGILDVTPEEVMMLQNPNFDKDAYLHPSQQLPPRWGTSPAGVGQLLSDLELTLQEIALKLRALQKSDLLNEAAKPPLLPPARPSDLCPLCNRVDVSEIEKRQHRALIDNISREVQAREAEALNLLQTANQERDAYKTRNLEMQEQVESLSARVNILESQVREAQESSTGPRDIPSYPMTPNPMSFDTVVQTTTALGVAAGAASTGADRPLSQMSSADEAPRPFSSASSTHIGQNGRRSSVATNASSGGISYHGVRRRSSSRPVSKLSGKASPVRGRSDSQASETGTGSIDGHSRSSSIAEAPTLRIQRGSPLSPQQRGTSKTSRGPSMHHSQSKKKLDAVVAVAVATTSLSKHMAHSGSKHRIAKSASRRDFDDERHSPLSKRAVSNANASHERQSPFDNTKPASDGSSPKADSNGSPIDPPLVIQLIINCKCCNGSTPPVPESTAKQAESAHATPNSEAQVATTHLAIALPLPRLSSVVTEDTDLVKQGMSLATSAVLPSPNPRAGTATGLKDNCDEDAPAATQQTEARSESAREFVVPSLEMCETMVTASSVAFSSKRPSMTSPKMPPLNPTNVQKKPSIAGQRHSLLLPLIVSSTFDGVDADGAPAAEEDDDNDTQDEKAKEAAMEGRRRSLDLWSQFEDTVIHKLRSDKISRLMRAEENTVKDQLRAASDKQILSMSKNPISEPVVRLDSARPAGAIPGFGVRVASSAPPESLGQSIDTKSPSGEQNGLTLPPPIRIPSAPALTGQKATAPTLSVTASAEEIEARRQRITHALDAVISVVEHDDLITAGLERLLAQTRTQISRLGGRLDAIAARSSVRPVGWLLHHIGAYYRAKRLADATAEHDGHAYVTAETFLTHYFKRLLGANEIVIENLHSVFATCKAFIEIDDRVKQFIRVLCVYDVRTCAFFLQLSLYVEQLSVGLDYSASHQHFAMDENPNHPEVLCLRRVAACLSETGLRNKSYGPLLWKAVTHKSLTMWAPDSAYFVSLAKAGFSKEALMHASPKDWSEAEVNLMRCVVPKHVFLAIACHFEMEDFGQKRAAMLRIAAPPKDTVVESSDPRRRSSVRPPDSHRPSTTSFGNDARKRRSLLD